MALWIQRGWKIPVDGLKQSIWQLKKELLRSSLLVKRKIGVTNQEVQNQYICHH